MNRWLDYTDPSDEPWWVDVLLIVCAVIVFVGITAVS